MTGMESWRKHTATSLEMHTQPRVATGQTYVGVLGSVEVGDIQLFNVVISVLENFHNMILERISK